MYKYKVVIADDEPVIRKNLKDLLLKTFEDIECVALCSDGNQVMTALQRGNIDIVITDIQMPAVTGLDIAEYIHSHKLHTKIILITGYSEFEYARKAISYGVQQFLLKPVNFNELISAVKIIKDAMAEHIETITNNSKNELKLRSMIRRYISLYLLGILPYSSLLEFDSVHFDLFSYASCAIIDIHVDEASAQESKVSADKWIDICEIQDDFINCFYISEYKNTVKLLFFIYAQDEQTGNEKVFGHMEECRRLMQSAYDIGFTYDVNFYKRLENQRLVDFNEIINIYIENLINKNTEANKEILDKVIASIPIQGICKFFKNAVYKLGEDYPLDVEMIELGIKNIVDNEDVLEFSQYLSEALQKASKNKDSISKVVLYVNEHFCEKELDLNRLSNRFHFNRSYLSRIFKQQTGKSPSKYIFDLRIAESKRLLQSKKYNIKQVAEMVGYSDEKYFGQAFKKATGITPSNFMHTGE